MGPRDGRNGTAGGISAPGEGIADIYGFLRLNDPCIGRGFFKNQVCSGYGDPCDGPLATGCTGIRNVDFMQHQCDRPHTVTWVTAGFPAGLPAPCGPAAHPACPGGAGTPCGRATHCEGKIVGETAFDLARRDLTAAPFNFDANTAHEINTRLCYLAAQPITSWYTCAVRRRLRRHQRLHAGLAADDDNGNLRRRHAAHDGHPGGVRAARDPLRHPRRRQRRLRRRAHRRSGPHRHRRQRRRQPELDRGAQRRALQRVPHRGRGRDACNFGKTKIAEVVAPTLTYSDTGLLAGRQYSYIVIPTGSAATCFGRASLCASATPTTAGACAVVSLAPTALSVDASGNGVLQTGEGVVSVAPSWQNSGSSASPVTGAASAFGGPVGPTYTLNDALANYGTINAGATAPCSDCYGVSITGSRPVQHWDASVLETVAPTGATKTWVAARGRQLHRRAGQQQLLPVRGDDPPQGRDRWLRGRTLLPGRLDEP